MNKSAVFRLKVSFPNVSGLALHQWNESAFIYSQARFTDTVYLLTIYDWISYQ